jgi:hypothetical protein
MVDTPFEKMMMINSSLELLIIIIYRRANNTITYNLQETNNFSAFACQREESRFPNFRTNPKLFKLLFLCGVAAQK